MTDQIHAPDPKDHAARRHHPEARIASGAARECFMRLRAVVGAYPQSHQAGGDLDFLAIMVLDLLEDIPGQVEPTNPEAPAADLLGGSPEDKIERDEVRFTFARLRTALVNRMKYQAPSFWLGELDDLVGFYLDANSPPPPPVTLGERARAMLAERDPRDRAEFVNRIWHRIEETIEKYGTFLDLWAAPGNTGPNGSLDWMAKVLTEEGLTVEPQQEAESRIEPHGKKLQPFIRVTWP